MAIINDFPIELAIWITNYVQIGDLANLARTSRKLHYIIDPVLYQRAKDIPQDLKQPHKNPLCYAALKGIPETINKCITAGFDVNMKLHYRIYPGNLERFRLQRRVEAMQDGSIWEKSWTTNETKGAAARTEDDLTVSESWALPLPYRPRIDHRSGKAMHSSPTALHIDVVGGHDETVEFLLNNGAIIDALVENMCDSRHRLQGSNVYDTILAHVTALHLAICYFRGSTVKLLLRRGASIVTMMDSQTPPHISLTALHTAAATAQVGLCTYLLDEGYVQNADLVDSHIEAVPGC